MPLSLFLVIIFRVDALPLSCENTCTLDESRD